MAAYHVFETKIIMYEEEVSPHVPLTDIRMAVHDKIPLRSGTQMCQNVSAKEKHGHEVRHESATQATKLKLAHWRWL
jgi:hypothetical protein